ncbi:MAG: Wzz/FepE/Etk N-terminal domain-containing protein, partial [Longimicrobiales bacterium]
MDHEETNLPPAELPARPPAVSELPARPGLASWEIVSPEAEPLDRAPDWRRYVGAVLRHKWLILLLVIVGTTAAVFAAQRLPQQYQAQSTIWIETQSEGGTGPIRSDQLLRSNAWIELLRSFVVLDHVVREERLYLQPKSPGDSLVFAGFTLAERFRPGSYRLSIDGSGRSYTLSTADGIRIEDGAPGDSIGAEIGFQWQPAPRALTAGRTIEFEVDVPREAAVELNNDLRTRIDQNGNFLRLELRMPTGTQAASVLNAIN